MNQARFSVLLILLAAMAWVLLKPDGPGRLGSHPELSDVPPAPEATAKPAGKGWEPPSTQPRVFRASGGREVRFSTPLLDQFVYPGDDEACAAIAGAELLADELAGLCQELKAAGPAERPALLQDLAFYTQWADIGDDDVAARIALSMSRAALDAVAPDDPEQAAEILSALPTEGIPDDNPYYDPGFLFASAIALEGSEAAYRLCPLYRSTGCDAELAAQVQPLIDIGRWRSDEAILVRAADYCERAFRTFEDPTPYETKEFAENFAEALGYASETADDRSRKAELLRRAIKPDEEWLKTYVSEEWEFMRQSVISSVAVSYGRIADLTNSIADARKALEYDTLAFDWDESWETQSNLSDSILLLAELERDVDGLNRALAANEEAMQEAMSSGSAANVQYMEMKLARTLQHVALANVALDQEERVAMLRESIRKAEESLPFFEESGATVYIDIARNIARDSRLALERIEAGWDPGEASPQSDPKLVE